MNEGLLISSVVTFIKFLSPIVMVLSIILFISPSLFSDLEKKLSTELGSKKFSRKSIETLEKENLLLQNMLLKYNRIVGPVIFVFSVVVFIRLYM